MKDRIISVIGLGYVGLPLAAAFAKHGSVIGFDIDSDKIKLYQQGVDPTNEVGSLEGCTVEFTSDAMNLRKASFHIVTVPTPIKRDKSPNLLPLISASKILGSNLTKDSIVVYESTVYPGVTEDVCVPILEEVSGLCCGTDFKIGYSPERINPGDTFHKLNNVVKIVSGMDIETRDIIAEMYGKVTQAGVYPVNSIRVAEAAKVIENCQRDINIAFVNELSLIFNKMGIDTQEVLRAAETKWNFLPFKPGLVGGHCIGVDPYYLAYAAEELDIHSQIILAGRKINDGMGKYVAEQTAKLLFRSMHFSGTPKVGVFGLTFKENCPDTRNTRVIDLIDELHEYGIETVVCDPLAAEEDVQFEHGISLLPMEKIRNLDGIILAVAHDVFKAENHWAGYYRERKPGVFVDVKGMFDRGSMKDYYYWRL